MNEFDRARRNAAGMSPAQRDRILRGQLGLSGAERSFASRRFDALSPSVKAHCKGGYTLAECQVIDAVYRRSAANSGAPAALPMVDAAKLTGLSASQASVLVGKLIQRGDLIESINAAGQPRFVTKLNGADRPSTNLSMALGVKGAVDPAPARKSEPSVTPVNAATANPPVGGPAATSGKLLADILAELNRVTHAVQALAASIQTAAPGAPGTASAKSAEGKVRHRSCDPVLRQKIAAPIQRVRINGKLVAVNDLTDEQAAALGIIRNK